MDEMIKLKGGYYQPGLSMRQYRFLGREKGLDNPLPVVNSHILMEKTAIDMKVAFNPDPDDEEKAQASEALVVGDALHKAVLEPEAFKRQEEFFLFGPTKGLATKGAIEMRKLHPGHIVLDDEGVILERVKRMLKALRDDEETRNAIWPEGAEDFTYRELTGVAPDPMGDFVRKIRVDTAFGILPTEPRLTDDYLLDVKTCRSEKFEPLRYKREVRDRGYHIQAAFYLDTDSLIRTGSVDHPRPGGFRHAVVESTYPHKVRYYRISEELLAEGREIIEFRLMTLAEAIRSGEWPGYPYLNGAPELV